MEEGDLIRRIIGKEAGQMVDIRPSRPGEIPAQKALWKTAFGDEDRLIDWFYDCCMPEEDMLLSLIHI